ncbi:4-hydroxy-3-methylbut-2-enyl diphosphate reductase [Termitidicoccus mucosus]|uniref:4-hydroxy-3-methylbut-2-enyl diphosphate reductase n=1 Tax=Termitidicoccus mucosus TaxID=1184151 RepID=A0A178ID38_9BACT|nr:4-hydroxy-3-methylbut-2-enyl diphosphate reductase [Opitutaceae bacterium TSB47]
MSVAILAFNTSNQLVVLHRDGICDLAFAGGNLASAEARLAAEFPAHTSPALAYAVRDHAPETIDVYFTQVPSPARPASAHGIASAPASDFRSLDSLDGAPKSPALAAVLAAIEPHLIAIPYLHLSEHDFIYKFRPDKERNRDIYQFDDHARALYQSRLCAAIKALSRTNERSATAPTALDFGPVRYLIPSHFGFCLGVKNAIERAYETLAENSGRRVFMLSELIHNPFVNEDLLRRGLRYLQTDKGVPLTLEGRKAAPDTPPGQLLWNTLTPDDIVIIPAFGATDDDKRRLVRKGVPVCQYDATCMLVEKVWKSARAFGRRGYTIIIHGKHEHEETKATFSNARRHAPALIIRNLDEARVLAGLISHPDAPDTPARFAAAFAGKHTPGFDPVRDLQRIAVVNQTTLLMNETIDIIEHLRAAYAALHGPAEARARVGGDGKRDTLCYATQVNQDALARALAEPLDAALVIGGKNSSNTYQLHRLCEQRLGSAAFFVQSEADIHSASVIQHTRFPAHGPAKGQTAAPLHIATTEPRPFLPLAALASAAPENPLRILLTGGASCPDGIIQQVITRINTFFPPDKLRPITAVLADLEG